MRTILLSATVCATIVGAMALGLVLGYAATLGILRMFGHRPRKQDVPPTGLLPAINPSGD